MKFQPLDAVVGVAVAAFLLATTQLPFIAVLGLGVGSACVFRLKKLKKR